jgi:hypothetical protein
VVLGRRHGLGGDFGQVDLDGDLRSVPAHAHTSCELREDLADLEIRRESVAGETIDPALARGTTRRRSRIVPRPFFCQSSMTATATMRTGPRACSSTTTWSWSGSR